MTPPPIYFNNPKARGQLVRVGIVYTLRRKRAEGVTRARTGTYTNFSDLGQVDVKEIDQHPGRALLYKVLGATGSDSIAEWRDAAKPGSDVLYSVIRIGP